VESEFAKVGKQLKRKLVSQLASGYRPELDASPELDKNRASYFASVLSWDGLTLFLTSICWLASRHVPEKDAWNRSFICLLISSDIIDHHWCLIGRNPAWTR
jgi:hypothetical protein